MHDIGATTRRLGELTIHNNRSDLLFVLAELLGCVLPLGRVLPDGARPDVVRLGIERRVLFIGDGKNTETPSCVATRKRLGRYAEWARAHVDTTHGVAILAICFGDEWQALGWRELLCGLADGVGVVVSDYGREDFGDSNVVVWVTLRSRRP